MLSKKERNAVFAALWEDRKYQRLHATKDRALEDYRSIFKVSPEHQANIQRRVKRALDRLQNYEDAALAKADKGPGSW